MKQNDDRIAIYSRKSKFTGKGESIGNQVELCREYIRAHYGGTAAENALIFEDEGFSGGDLNRPDFKKMMDEAKERRFTAIIVYRLDRISRNISDFAGLIEELARLGIDFVSIREQFDTGSPMGRAMMYIASVFSQLERETIAQRIRDNMRQLARTGRWLGGITPTGYASESVQRVTIDGKTKKACKLKLIPEEAELVKLIYRLYVETDSQTATEAELLKRGVKTKNGREFSRFAIKGILGNPVYAVADRAVYDYFVNAQADLCSRGEEFDGVHGVMAYHRTDQAKGRATVCLPTEQWIVAVGQHPGLIPGKVWVRVQESLARNKSKSYRKPRINRALLTGLLYCGCGSRMYPKLGKGRGDDGQLVYTYVCRRKERSQRGLCCCPNANGNALDMAVVEGLKGLESHRGTFLCQLEESRRFYAGGRGECEARLAALRQERADAEKRAEGLVDALARLEEGGVRDQVAKRIQQLNGQCEALDARLQTLEGLSRRDVLSDSEFEDMRQRLSAFRGSMDQMGVEQKRAAVRTLVRQVVWDGAEAHVVLFGTSVDEEKTGPLDGCKTHWGEDSK